MPRHKPVDISKSGPPMLRDSAGHKKSKRSATTRWSGRADPASRPLGRADVDGLAGVLADPVGAIEDLGGGRRGLGASFK